MSPLGPNPFRRPLSTSCLGFSSGYRAALQPEGPARVWNAHRALDRRRVGSYILSTHSLDPHHYSTRYLATVGNECTLD